ncbi:DUF1932 domain-containing protein [Thermodesulfobacteriota bacterium]
MFTIGFIGFGEAAYQMSEGLRGEGFAKIIAYDKYWNIEPNSELISERAEKTQVELVPNMQALIENSDMIISAVSADMALELAESASPFLKHDQIYVDINATSPMTMEEVDAIISPVAVFVDCAAMGPFPIYQHKTPLLVSGKGAALFTEKMAPFGMDITLMDKPAGSASATKMFRSIFMKGFIAQSLETLFAARKYQVEDVVLMSLKESFTVKPFLEMVNVLLTRGVIHSERREHEMEEVIDTLKNLNLDSTMSQATRTKMKWVTDLGLRDHFKGVPPKDLHEIFTALE